MSNLMSISYSLNNNWNSALKASSLVLLQFIILNLTGIVYLAVAARFLAKFDMSLLLMASVLINGFTTLFTLAYNYTAAKYIADLLGSNKVYQAKHFGKLIVYLGLLCSIISLGVGYLVAYLIFLPFNLSYQYILLISIDGAINCLLFFFYGILLGFFEFKKAVFSFSLASASRFLLSVVVILFYNNVNMVLKTWILGDSLGLISFLVFSKDIIFKKYNKDKEVFSLARKSILFSLPIYISSLITYLYLYIDRYLVLYNSGLENYAIYGTAITASLILMNLPQLISNALLPHFSYILSENKQLFLETVNSTIRVICTALSPFIIAIAMLAEPIMSVFAGIKYTEGWFIFFIVTLAIGITFPIASLTSALLALDKSKIIMYSNIVAIAIGTALTQLFYQNYGINGAAFGRASLFILSFLFISSWFYKRERSAYNASFHIKTALVSLLLFSPMLLLNIYRINLSLPLLILFIISSILLYLYLITKYRLLNEIDIRNLSILIPSPFNKFFYNFFTSLIKPPKIEKTIPNVKYTIPSSYMYIYVYVKPHMQ